MKSLSNDIRMQSQSYSSNEGKTQESIQDHKNSNIQSSKKLQQLIEANIQCESAIKLLQKEVDKLQGANKVLDQQLQIKRKQLEDTQKQLQLEQQKEQAEGQQEMHQWINHVQNYSGVPQEVIDSLIALEYEGPAQDNEICLSCYQTMQVGAQCKYLPCCHLFHAQCVNNHLKVNKLCPACGQPVSQ